VAYRVSNGTIANALDDLKGHIILLFETFITSIDRETKHKFTNIARRAVPPW